jgi:hypothetical protein
MSRIPIDPDNSRLKLGVEAMDSALSAHLKAMPGMRR